MYEFLMVVAPRKFNSLDIQELWEFYALVRAII